MLRAVTSAVILALAITTGAALAETTPTTTPATSPTDKAAISKACSDQADAQNLHGKARKKFRAACKKRGGKPAT
jgi:hypothetical protein